MKIPPDHSGAAHPARATDARHAGPSSVDRGDLAADGLDRRRPRCWFVIAAGPGRPWHSDIAWDILLEPVVGPGGIAWSAAAVALYALAGVVADRSAKAWAGFGAVGAAVIFVVHHLALFPLGLAPSFTAMHLIRTTLLTGAWCGLVKIVIAPRSALSMAGLQGPKAPVVRWNFVTTPVLCAAAPHGSFCSFSRSSASSIFASPIFNWFTAANWRNLAENNRLRRFPMPGPRGWIYDRRGRVLAENLPSWELLLFPNEAANVDRTGVFLHSWASVMSRSFASVWRNGASAEWPHSSSAKT